MTFKILPLVVIHFVGTVVAMYHALKVFYVEWNMPDYKQNFLLAGILGLACSLAVLMLTNSINFACVALLLFSIGAFLAFEAKKVDAEKKSKYFEWLLSGWSLFFLGIAELFALCFSVYELTGPRG